MGTVVYLVQERIDGIFSLPLEIGGLILLGAATYGLTALFFQVEVSHSLLRTATELAGRYIRGVPKTT
jgi:hypothetical protein